MTQESPVSYFSQDPIFFNAGKALIDEGKVAAIVLAGGHGSRLGYNAPKGCFPVGNPPKSLYERLLQKIPSGAFLGIMTSDATDEKTKSFFEESHYFGLKKEQIFFFQQENLPLENSPYTAPDGNGALFWHLQKSGTLEAWKKAGIEYVTVFTIDNALVEPFQPDLIGITALHKNDATVVGIKRENPQEHVGVLVTQNGKLAVVEYSEMPDSERLAYAPNGMLKYPLANISYFAFSIHFIQKVITHKVTELPLHKARKKIGNEYFIKSEYFIFDTLVFADKSEILLLPREQFFAPLKNATGPQSPETVNQALELNGQ